MSVVGETLTSAMCTYDPNRDLRDTSASARKTPCSKVTHQEARATRDFETAQLP